MIPHSFWKDVENTVSLKYVLYGDSVTEDTHSIVKFENGIVKHMGFGDIWSELITTYNKRIAIENGKEFIFNLNGTLQVMNYDVDIDSLQFSTPTYIMRHSISKNIFKLELANGRNLKATKDHGMLGYDGSRLYRTTADIVDYVPGAVISNSDDRQYVYVKTDNPSKSITSMALAPKNILHDINPIKIQALDEIEYSGYVYDFEVPHTHNFTANGIVVHNTDSIYINIPLHKDHTTEELVGKADDVSEQINDQIKYFIESTFLPKLGTDIEYNRVHFKTEIVSNAIMFLDIKKNYALTELAENGGIHSTPETKYTGIPVVKTNISKFTKNFIRELVQDIALDDTIDKTEMNTRLRDVAKKYWLKLKADCIACNLEDIGIPCKWSNSQYAKEPSTVIAMRAFNTFVGEDILMPSQAAIHFPIIISKPAILMNTISKSRNRSEFCLGNTNVNNINYLAVPFNYTTEQIQKIMSEFELKINQDEYWRILYNKVAQRIVDTIKQYIAQP